MRAMRKLLAGVMAVVMTLSMCVFVTGAEVSEKGEATPVATGDGSESTGVEETSGVALKVKVKEGKVYVTLKVEDDLQTFQYGITYKAEQVEVTANDWDLDFFLNYCNNVGSMGMKENSESRQYVVFGGTTMESYPYEGPIGCVTFTPKEGVNVLDSIKVYANPKKLIDDTEGATTLESIGAAPLAETGQIDVTKDTLEEPGDNPDEPGKDEKPINPPVSITAQSVESNLTVVISGNNDFKQFSFGITYNKEQLEPMSFQWNGVFSGSYQLFFLGMGGALESGIVTENQYVAMGGTHTSKYDYDGELATICFKVKDGVSVVDSICVVSNPAVVLKETGAATLAEAGKGVVAETGRISLNGTSINPTPGIPADPTGTPADPTPGTPADPTGTPADPTPGTPADPTGTPADPTPGIPADPTGTPADPTPGTPADPTGTPADPTPGTPADPTGTPADPTPGTPADPTGTPVDPTGTPVDPTKEAVMGDVTDDGFVKLDDAQRVLRAALLLETLSKEKQIAADVNQDGLVKLDDAQQILRKALLLLDEFEKAK